jgi:hypothetical protein
VLGGAGGGSIADAFGDVTAFVGLAALCLAIAVVLIRTREPGLHAQEAPA